MFRPKAIIITIISTLYFSVSSIHFVLANNNSNIRVSEVTQFYLTEKLPSKINLLAWSHGGSIYYLDTNLNVVKKIIFNNITFSHITQISNSLFMLARRYSKGKKIENLIIQYSIIEGIEKGRWVYDKYLIWSLSSENNKLIVMSSDGERLQLSSNGLQSVAKYPRKSHYISTNDDEPIICTDPNTTKQHWKLASCYRKGKYNWKKDGEWGSLLKPFMCNNYLIENNKKSLRRKLSATISVRDISNGKEISKKNVDKVLAMNCSGTNIIHGLNSSIIIRKIPSLEIVHRIKTKSRRIESVAKIGNFVYWVDEKYKLHKRDLQ